MGKLKISRPMLWGLILAAAVIIGLVVTQPKDAPKKPVSRTRVVVASRGANAALAGGITDEDRKARFDRYKGPEHDAFLPLVVSAVSLPPVVHPGGPLGPGGKGAWTLTGITATGGQRIALVENTTTGDTQFLKPGDLWNGHRVLRIQQDDVLLSNDQGQQTQLTFPVPPDVTTPGGSGTAPPAAAPGAANPAATTGTTGRGGAAAVTTAPNGATSTRP